MRAASASATLYSVYRFTSCTVRVVAGHAQAYHPQPAIAWETVLGVCPELLLQSCRPSVRVELHAALWEEWGAGGVDASVGESWGGLFFAPHRAAAVASVSGAGLAWHLSREVFDAYLARTDIAPGEALGLRTYSVGLKCTFTRPGGPPSFVSLAPVRVEIRQPQPQPLGPQAQA
eukprot:tig00001307_g8126.t1